MLGKRLATKVLVAAIFTGVTAWPAQAQLFICSENNLTASTTPGSLRQIIAECGATEISLKALIKLNNYELRNVPLLTRQKAYKRDIKDQDSVKSSSFVLFFATGETFPTEKSLEDLANLIKQLNRDSKSIVSINIKSTVDSAESDSPLASSIANGRSNIIKKYFQMAGVRPDSISTNAISMNKTNTKNISSKDRSTIVEINTQ